MKAIITQEEDCCALLDQLELAKLRQSNTLKKETDPVSIDEMHRTFHFVVVRWLQAHGARGVRS